MNSIDNYIKTNISNIYLSSPLKDNNFNSIINLYEIQQNNNIKNYNNKKNFILENHRNSMKKNNDDMEIDIESNNDEKTKTAEISESGAIQIKNNKNENINFKIEDNNNILDCDDKAESIFMKNNQYYNNSSNNKYNNNINFKNNNNSDFILQDIPLNINEDNYIYKWKKISYLYKAKNNNLIKQKIFNIIERLIASKKINDTIHKIEILKIAYDNTSNDNPKIQKVKGLNESTSLNINVHNSYNNNNIPSIKDSIDSSASYENLTNIITTTQINNLSNSTDFKNTINNINININNAKLILPHISKYNEEKENIIPPKKINYYQKTDLSKIIQKNNILDSEKYKKVIDFLQYKDNLFIQKINNTDSANVRISLESGKIKKNMGVYIQLKKKKMNHMILYQDHLEIIVKKLHLIKKILLKT